MNKLSYDNRCKCKQKLSLTKRPSLKKKSKKEGRPFRYPCFEKIKSQTFQIIYEKELSPTAVVILNTFQKKYFYHAVDDILYSLTLTKTEREKLLSLLCSPVFSLQNTFCIDFFDVWIHELYVNENLKVNRFAQSQFKNSFEITIKVFYKIKTLNATNKFLW